MTSKSLLTDVGAIDLQVPRDLNRSIDPKIVRKGRPADRLGAGRAAALWSDLPRLGMPVMLIRGSDSAFVTQDDLDEMTRLLPAMRVEVVPGAGHAVQSDQPAALAVLISDFLPRELTIRGDRGQLLFWSARASTGTSASARKASFRRRSWRPCSPCC